MNEIFGVPTTTIMLFLLAIFALCMSMAIYVALRYRVVFKLGLRNIPRRPSQTILIVVGLMLSTLIIAAAFTTGDTLDLSIKNEVFEILGQTDERILPDTASEDPGAPTGAVMSQSVVVLLEQRLADDPDIDGIMPFLSESIPAINANTQLSEPALQLTGLDIARLDPFGGVQSVDGEPIDMSALSEDGVVIGEAAAENLEAEVGHQLIIYTRGEPHSVTVEAIAEDSMLTGYNSPGAPGGMAVSLEKAQRLFGYSDRISSVEITNHGGVESGAEYTDSAMQALDDALANTPYRAIPVKQDHIEMAQMLGNVFLTMFLVFGLFSIAVGVLLIFLIFVMLAAERKSEMGMARAVGMKRRQLTEMFLAEGIAYDLVSALIGAALGVGVAFLIAQFAARIVGEWFTITPTATWQSLVIAYTLGVVVTFVTILISSWRITNLNIVRAIRDIPEPMMPRAGRRWLIFGIAGLLIGVFATWAGGTAGNAFAFLLGLSLVPLSLAALLRHFGVPARPLYSVAAVTVLVLWLLPESVSNRIFPETTGGIEMFFLSGIMLVAASTVLIVWNAPVITSVISLFGRTFSRWLPAVKTAVAYPLERKGRTGMTIAMFSLVIFSLVMMSTITATANQLVFGSDAAAGGWDIQATQATTNAVDDIEMALEQQGVATEDIAVSAKLVSITPDRTQIRMSGDQEWKTYQINGANESFIEESNLPLQTLAIGYDNEQAVWEALQNDPSVVIVDNDALTQGGNLAAPPNQFALEGVDPDDETMEPTEIEIADPLSGTVRTFTVIGVIDVKVVAFPGVLMSQQTYDEIFRDPANTSYITHVVRVSPNVDAEQMAREVESSLVAFGVQATTYDEIIDMMTSQSQGFLTLIEAFMMLGLVVGVAALGVLAFRSVVERRQQIGMLRAIGYKRSMVAASFLIESSMITILGILSGTVLALLLSWNLINSDYAFGENVDMVVPFGEIGIFLLIALAASLLMAWVPSRRAARVPVAAALRYE
jgi:putative ABC transport system permease protein